MRPTSQPTSPAHDARDPASTGSFASSHEASQLQTPAQVSLSPALSEAEVQRVRDGLDVAQSFVDKSQAVTALGILLPLPGDAAPHDHYAYEAKLGLAFMGRADELVAASALGALALPADGAAPRLKAERVGCYVGVLGAYGRMSELLAAGPERTRFIEKNGESTLLQVQEGVSHGMAHAFLETMGFFDLMARANLNRQTGPAMMDLLMSGRLTLQDPVAYDWFSMQANPLMGAVVTQTQHVQLAMTQGPFAFAEAWGTWAAEHKAHIASSPTVQRALRYMPSVPELQQSLIDIRQDPVARAWIALAEQQG